MIDNERKGGVLVVDVRRCRSVSFVVVLVVVRSIGVVRRCPCRSSFVVVTAVVAGGRPVDIRSSGGDGG